MTSRFVVSIFAIATGCLCQPADTPFACNLKAFTPAQRARHRDLSRRLPPAVVAAEERSNGYALSVDPRRLSVAEVAEWMDLERKCCPFFDFTLDLQGESGALRLVLAGRDGVKQFIRMEFAELREKLEGAKKLSVP